MASIDIKNISNKKLYAAIAIGLVLLLAIVGVSYAALVPHNVPLKTAIAVAGGKFSSNLESIGSTKIALSTNSGAASVSVGKPVSNNPASSNTQSSSTGSSGGATSGSSSSSGGSTTPGSGSTSPSPAPTPTPTPTPPVSQPSGVAAPTGNKTGWKLMFSDDFTVSSTTSDGMNWKSLTSGSKIVYTGKNLANGGSAKWVTYPETYKDTYQKRAYMSGDVLSTHNGVMDFYLHSVNGQPAGANPSPLIDGVSQYQLYGRYSARIKTDTTNLQGYYAAWLLWPQLDSNYKCAESDYPEGSLASTSGQVGGFHHYGCSGSQDAFSGAAKFTDWHTYTQEWGPGFRKYYIDDTLIKTTNNQVWSQPQRWQLQTETNGTGTFGSGHLLVDWVAAYSYAP